MILFQLNLYVVSIVQRAAKLWAMGVVFQRTLSNHFSPHGSIFVYDSLKIMTRNATLQSSKTRCPKLTQNKRQHFLRKNICTAVMYGLLLYVKGHQYHEVSLTTTSHILFYNAPQVPPSVNVKAIPTVCIMHSVVRRHLQIGDINQTMIKHTQGTQKRFNLTTFSTKHESMLQTCSGHLPQSWCGCVEEFFPQVSESQDQQLQQCFKGNH